MAGTRGIHNAGFVDWPKFVSTWGFGGTFGESIERSTLGGIASTIMQWFGGEGVDNGWILDGEPNITMDSPLLPPAK